MLFSEADPAVKADAESPKSKEEKLATLSVSDLKNELENKFIEAHQEVDALIHPDKIEASHIGETAEAATEKKLTSKDVLGRLSKDEAIQTLDTLYMYIGERLFSPNVEGNQKKFGQFMEKTKLITVKLESNPSMGDKTFFRELENVFNGTILAVQEIDPQGRHDFDSLIRDCFTTMLKERGDAIKAEKNPPNDIWDDNDAWGPEFKSHEEKYAETLALYGKVKGPENQNLEGGPEPSPRNRLQHHQGFERVEISHISEYTNYLKSLEKKPQPSESRANNDLYKLIHEAGPIPSGEPTWARARQELVKNKYKKPIKKEIQSQLDQMRCEFILKNMQAYRGMLDKKLKEAS